MNTHRYIYIFLTGIIITIGIFYFTGLRSAGNIEGILAEYGQVREDTGKYPQVDFTQDAILGNFVIHEYETPTGELGQQIFIFGADDNFLEEAFGTGPEADGRTYLVEQPIYDNTSSTDN